MFELSRRTHSLQFMDTCPSEYMHTFPDKILVHSLINYYHLDFEKVSVLQYKATRKERKLAAQERIINAFEKGHVQGCGVITCNSQRYAMENARKFLVDAGYLNSGPLDLEARIEIAGQVIGTGVLLSLAWYAYCLATNFRTAAIFTQVENKNKVFIAMDFLPGDNGQRSKSLNVIKEFTRHTQFRDLLEQAVNHYKVSIGYGYAGDPSTGGSLKNAPPLCISDWINHSFYAKLRRKNIVPDDKHAQLQPFTALADYLEEKGMFKVAPTIRFTDAL
jgi:hypothetical protein